MDEGEIARGAIETVAENTSDGVTAPLFWALIGGAPLAMVYRAANTCDSMVGHLNDRYIEFGWASAKWDDVMNWIPSRVTGMIMLIGKRPVKMPIEKPGRFYSVMQKSIRAQTAAGVKRLSQLF